MRTNALHLCTRRYYVVVGYISNQDLRYLMDPHTVFISYISVYLDT